MAVNKSDSFSSKILDFQGNRFPIVHERSMDWRTACNYFKASESVCTATCLPSLVKVCVFRTIFLGERRKIPIATNVPVAGDRV